MCGGFVLSGLGRAVAVIAAILIVAAVFLYFSTTTRKAEVIEARTTEGFVLSSPAFADGGKIPTKYTCDGVNVSPPLKWDGVPGGTKSLALLVEDPDAPGGVFTHWIVYGISPDVREIKEGETALGAVEGSNDFGKTGYAGPCPPPGKPHRYVFKLLALDSLPQIDDKPTRERFNEAIKGHVIAEARLTGIYSK